jgi:hypothetical protein
MSARRTANTVMMRKILLSDGKFRRFSVRHFADASAEHLSIVVFFNFRYDRFRKSDKKSDKDPSVTGGALLDTSSIKIEPESVDSAVEVPEKQ